MARWLFALLLLSLVVGTGCCCMPNCGSCGGCGSCGFPQPLIWNGCCNECGPSPHESCADCCGECGILPFLTRSRTCGRGCGEIYCDEWFSDPPDCCDPCDKCTGCWTGPHGYCCLGPCQRLLAALHGYRYCPPPDCGPSCGPLCQTGSCGAACSCNDCGGVGCASCGGGMHGVPVVDGGVHTIPHGASLSPGVGHPSILHENWDTPKTQPTPGKPVHNAQQPPRGQMTRNTRLPPPQMLRQQVGSPAQPTRYTQPQAWGRSPEQVTEDRRAATSVRRANYTR